MHPNRHFRWDDEAAMLEFIRAAGFARIIAATPKGLRIAHVPVLVGPGARLRFHLALGNALTGPINGAVAVALVEGPHAYVSANWYADQSGAVPTWNYVAVEAEGQVRRLDRPALIQLVDELAAHLEPMVGENWNRTKMDPARFDAMLSGIRGFEMAVTDLRGTRKLSQNKPEHEAARLIAGMDGTGQFAMAAAMRSVRGSDH